MTKYLLLMSLLFVNPVYANDTTVSKKKHTNHSFLKHSPNKKPSVEQSLSDAEILAIMEKYNVGAQKQKSILIAINNAAKKHNINKSLIVAMIARESSFKQFAVSKKGARGLLQIMPSHKLANPFHIPSNIDRGVEILAQYIKESGSVTSGLARYGNSIAYVYEVKTTLRQLKSMV